MTGWWRMDGANMENNPPEPDVWVAVAPGDIPSGNDALLRKAVEAALEELR